MIEQKDLDLLLIQTEFKSDIWGMWHWAWDMGHEAWGMRQGA